MCPPVSGGWESPVKLQVRKLPPGARRGGSRTSRLGLALFCFSHNGMLTSQEAPPSSPEVRGRVREKQPPV